LAFASFGWPVAGADLLWEKNILADRWLMAGAKLMWEKNTAGWLSQPAEQGDCLCIVASLFIELVIFHPNKTTGSWWSHCQETSRAHGSYC
jgi:hypothetical protein